MSLQALIEKLKKEAERTKAEDKYFWVDQDEILKLIEAVRVMKDALEIYDQQLPWLSPKQVLEKADQICEVKP